ncbi:heavy metal translocating P-type ATPase [Halioxenophilus aromaticivorans]|uniref:P-type Cu(2+) transporter n=1 Tax=Halioxenophilus aromaticivorans TaxID=1306992 RepID=A0AAV3TYM9_9ALTE
MSQSAQPACFHCSLLIPNGAQFESELDGQQRRFCCPGCQAVAETIYQSGLDGFYQFRSQSSARPDLEILQKNYLAYDLPQLQQEFVTPVAAAEEGAQLQAQFLIEGITCAACVWLIEHHLSAIDGVESVAVNAATGRAKVRWQAKAIKLSEILSAVATIGYRFTPATEDHNQQRLQQERRLGLMRIAVAGFGMMQVGMVAVAIYAGASGEWLSYWRWISLIIATPVVLFSARPFFTAAWRALKNRHLVMDVPVCIAIAFAYTASVWATLTQTGEVYFDSVSMFTFFLLLGRYFEMSTRHGNQFGMTRMAQLLPLTATRLQHNDSVTDQEGERDGSGRELVPLRALSTGDRVMVAEGETVPCDGVVLAGRSRVDESLLTGEAHPINKSVGANVVAGSSNLDSPLTVEVTAVGANTTLSAIESLVDSAGDSKPKQVILADRLASWFVAAVLLISAVTGYLWYLREPSHALWVVLSVLVVTCPCALSLATPTAHAAALSRLRREGLLVINSDTFTALAKITHIVFDKTGTLTVGQPQVTQVDSLGEVPREKALAIIASLERDSKHPIAKAFAPWQNQISAVDVRNAPSAGVSGVVDGCRYFFGRPEYVAQAAGLKTLPEPTAQDASASLTAFARAGELLAWVALADATRDSARPVVDLAKQAGLTCVLLSGDQPDTVAQVADQLAIADYRGRCLPEHKLAAVQALQGEGKVVLMVGDGINDVPVLSGADVSVAMSSATDLARAKADALLLAGDLTLLVRAQRFAKKLQRTIKQNLLWALAYNGLALPLAVLGLIPPWAAAIGMSASSLVVVINALRLSRASV